MEITEEELKSALKRVRMWLRPESIMSLAFQGYLLHPEDVAGDIMIAVQHERVTKDKK